jgi:hypothetical protein
MDADVRAQLLQNALSWLLPVVTAVDEGPAAQPTQLTLHGNFPNPFNPKTRIAFDLPAASAVSLAVYDVNGRLLCQLVDGRLEAGRHEVVWDGKSAGGHDLASGLYFYRLEAGAETLTRKMLMLK